MNQVQASRFWPIGAWSSTYNFNFYWRANEGSGTYSYFAGSPLSVPTLSLSAPTGQNSGFPVVVMVEAVVRHLLNNRIGSWYSPPLGTVEEALRLAMEAFIPNSYTGGTQYANIYFDGQFGSVYVG